MADICHLLSMLHGIARCSIFHSRHEPDAPTGDILAFATQKEIDRQNTTNLETALDSLFPGNQFGNWAKHAAYALVGKKGNIIHCTFQHYQTTV